MNETLADFYQRSFGSINKILSECTEGDFFSQLFDTSDQCVFLVIFLSITL